MFFMEFICNHFRQSSILFHTRNTVPNLLIPYQPFLPLFFRVLFHWERWKWGAESNHRVFYHLFHHSLTLQTGFVYASLIISESYMLSCANIQIIGYFHLQLKELRSICVGFELFLPSDDLTLSGRQPGWKDMLAPPTITIEFYPLSSNRMIACPV